MSKAEEEDVHDTTPAPLAITRADDSWRAIVVCFCFHAVTDCCANACHGAEIRDGQLPRVEQSGSSDSLNSALDGNGFKLRARTRFNSRYRTAAPGIILVSNLRQFVRAVVWAGPSLTANQIKATTAKEEKFPLPLPQTQLYLFSFVFLLPREDRPCRL